MIFDGRWKWELKKLSWAISLWKKTPSHSEYGKYELNRLFYTLPPSCEKPLKTKLKQRKLLKSRTRHFPNAKS